jgi:hypothetical protein
MPFAQRQQMYFRQCAENTGYTGRGTNKLRRDWGTYDKPQEPAPSLPDSHAETAKRLLEKRGWTLVKNASGTWQLSRVPNF